MGKGPRFQERMPHASCVSRASPAPPWARADVHVGSYPCDWGAVRINRDHAWENTTPGARFPEPPDIPVKSLCAKGSKRKCCVLDRACGK